MVKGYNTSNGIELGTIVIVDNPCSYTDANQLKTRQFGAQVSSQPGKGSNIQTIYSSVFDKNDADDKITVASDEKEGRVKGNFANNKSKYSITIVDDERENGNIEEKAFKENKFSISIVSKEKVYGVTGNCVFKKSKCSITKVRYEREDDSTENFAYNKGKPSTILVSDETKNGITGHFAYKESKSSITRICDEKENGITVNFVFKNSKSSVSLYDFYKGFFVNDGDATRPPSHEIDNSSNCNERQESNIFISILAYGYGVRSNGNRSCGFQKNLENNRNYTTTTTTTDRERVIKSDSSKGSNYAISSNVLYKVDVRRGETGSSASLEVGMSYYCRDGSETYVSTCTWQPAGNSQYICPGNSEHNFCNVEYFKNINEIGFEKSGFESFFLFALLLKNITIIIEAYSDCFTSKGNKNLKYGPIKFQLVVVSSELFEEAMRQCHIETVELTYTNVFPSDCRMFIGVPIYKYGYIHRKDQL